MIYNDDDDSTCNIPEENILLSFGASLILVDD